MGQSHLRALVLLLDSCHQSGMSLPLRVVAKSECFVLRDGMVKCTSSQNVGVFDRCPARRSEIVYRYTFYFDSYEIVLI